MSAARDMRAEMRRARPMIDNEIRAARNMTMAWVRAAARHFDSAAIVFEDHRDGYLPRGTTQADADRLALDWMHMAHTALEWAASSRREMHRLIRFRRTAIPE